LLRSFSLIILLAVLCNTAVAGGGGDSLISPPQKVKDHSPKKAVIMSAILPGLGQAYNKKYWKIPIIYGGLISLGYVVKFNNDNFQDFKKAYVYRVDDNPNTIDKYVDRYTTDNLNTLQDYYHRNRDLSAIGMTAFYLLNIIDAAVDAHLYQFELKVNDDLSLQMQPTNMVFACSRPVPGITLKIHYK